MTINTPMNIYLFSDIIGIFGVSFVVIAFFMVQLEKMEPNSSIYLYLNFWGSIMLLFSLYYHWNLASVITEVIWLIITIYGIIKFKIIRPRRQERQVLDDDLLS